MSAKFIKLTRANIRSCKAGQKIEEHGIYFKRFSNGDGCYRISTMIDGQRIHRTVGKESEGVTRQQAEELMAKLKTDARHGRLNLPKGRKTALSFREAAEQYIKRQVAEGGKNLYAKRCQLKLHLVPFFGNMALNKITSSDVERYKKHRSEQFVAPQATKTLKAQKLQEQRTQKLVQPNTINNELATLSHLAHKALEWNWIEKPIGVKKYKQTPGRITYLTIEQIDRLVVIAKKNENAQIYPFIAIGLATAMRRMEILSIRLADINLEKLTIYIPKAKAGAREQPITKELAECLTTYLKTIDHSQKWLFPSEKSSTGHTMNIEKTFRRVVSAAGLDHKKVVRHTLRHTAITHLVQAGVDLPTVKRISGHKTLQMVERYSHQNGSHIQAAMEKLAQRYKGNFSQNNL